MAMGGVMSRMRAVTHGLDGLVSLGDAWACTNPAMGRGMSFGLAHAALLRRAAREHAGRPAALTAMFAADTERELAPYHRATMATDRTRLAEIDALLAGEEPPPANPLVRAMQVDAGRLPRRARHHRLPRAAPGGLRPPGLRRARAGRRRRAGSSLTRRQAEGRLRTL